MEERPEKKRASGRASRKKKGNPIQGVLRAVADMATAGASLYKHAAPLMQKLKRNRKDKPNARRKRRKK